MARPESSSLRRSNLGVTVVYLSAALQGVSLITPAAAAVIITSPEFHGLSNSQYGSTFLPMIIVAILASLYGPRLAARRGIRSVLRLGLLGNAAFMGLLASSSLAEAGAAAYGVLLAAMGALGLGFGLTMTAVNAYAVAFFPARADAAVTALHASLGVGTAVAPLLLGGFLVFGAWPAHPLTVLAVLLISFAFTVTLPRRLPPALTGSAATEHRARELPRRLFLYAGALILYATAEGTFSSWAVILVSAEKGFSLAAAGFALAAFWGMLTVGRIVAAVVFTRIRAEWFYPLSPIGITASFLLIPVVNGEAAVILAFGLAGLSASFFAPLTYSFPSKEFPYIVTTVSGAMVASNMLGIGIGSLAVGVVSDFGAVDISTIYAFSAAYTVLLFVLAYYLARGRLRLGLGNEGR
ncbi:MAG: sugar MFS transporter [Thermoplasmata archaeon]